MIKEDLLLMLKKYLTVELNFHGRVKKLEVVLKFADEVVCSSSVDLSAYGNWV